MFTVTVKMSFKYICTGSLISPGAKAGLGVAGAYHVTLGPGLFEITLIMSGFSGRESNRLIVRRKHKVTIRMRRCTGAEDGARVFQHVPNHPRYSQAKRKPHSGRVGRGFAGATINRREGRIGVGSEISTISAPCSSAQWAPVSHSASISGTCHRAVLLWNATRALEALPMPFHNRARKTPRCVFRITMAMDFNMMAASRTCCNGGHDRDLKRTRLSPARTAA